MKLNNNYFGLTDEQVELSRKQFGSNILTPPAKKSLWIQFLEKFRDPIIKVLLVALLLSIGISAYHYLKEDAGSNVFFEPTGIFLAVILSTGIAFWFEVRANKAFDILNKVNDDEPVQTMRNGVIKEVAKKNIVVGDIVILNTGNEIPADGELIEATSLQVNESTLTGEPIVKKSIVPDQFDKEATYPTNHVMRGTTVVEGHAVYRVTKVGDATENGKVYTAAQIDNNVETPLNIQLKKLSSIITKVSYTLAALIIVGRIATYFYSHNTFEALGFGNYLLNTVMLAVTLVVVSIPEGLPMSVTLSLAMSMRRMLKTNNLVRKMHACETMGAATVICTDKTGTLTQNQMQVAETKFYALPEQKLSSNDESALISEGISVNSTAFLDLSDEQKSKVIGNPTEGALLLWLHKNGIDYLSIRNNAQVIDQLIFSTERKYMATLVQSQAFGRRILYVKGAPEIILGLCSTIEANVTANEIDEQLRHFQSQAMRTLGFAYKFIDKDQPIFKNGKLCIDDLCFMGIVSIADPVRKDVPAAVKECMDAGIEIKIVTGDTPTTAREIGRQIGLWNEKDGAENEITGPEFEALTDEELQEKVKKIKIIARARPMDKARLVKALQNNGEVVAVTGDGTNDAPALKSAHVGLSMGDGTSVAKEASDITIIDNSFGSITKAVLWGRSLYQNIQRFILFQMTINVVACVIVLLGAFLGTESPITVTQMLWVNLIMDTFAAMALASLPPSHSVMKEKPRRRTDFIICKSMWWQILGVGAVFIIVLFALLQCFKHADITSLFDADITAMLHNVTNFTFVSEGLTTYEISLFFSFFVFMQFWNMFNAKAFKTGKSAFHFKGCQSFVFIAFLIVIGQLIIVTFGGEMFSVCPLKTNDWIVIIAATASILIVGEIIRFFKKIISKAK